MSQARQMPMVSNNPARQKGYLLFEYLVVAPLIAALVMSVFLVLQEGRERDNVDIRAAWAAQYMMAIGSYMTQQGAAPPGTLVRTGTDWLKANTCGGLFPPDDQHLPCSIPTNFNGDMGLQPPVVTFDWSTPQAPVASIDFGTIVDAGNQPSAVRAAAFVTAANAEMRAVNFSYASLFTVDPDDPGTDPATNPAAFVARLQSGQVGGIVDAGIPSQVFVRLDGNSVMTGPLFSEHDNWAMVARDAAGAENADPADPAASANLNDVFVRASSDLNGSGYWVSETHELAREAYELASRASVFTSNVRSGGTVSKPSCPGSLVPRIYASPAGFIGGNAPTNSAFIAGIRILVNDLGSAWRLTMEALFDGSSGFEAIPTAHPQMGLIEATVRCEDP